jgi:hypothetical protein
MLIGRQRSVNRTLSLAENSGQVRPKADTPFTWKAEQRATYAEADSGEIRRTRHWCKPTAFCGRWTGTWKHALFIPSPLQLLALPQNGFSYVPHHLAFQRLSMPLTVREKRRGTWPWIDTTAERCGREKITQGKIGEALIDFTRSEDLSLHYENLYHDMRTSGRHFGVSSLRRMWVDEIDRANPNRNGVSIDLCKSACCLKVTSHEI